MLKSETTKLIGKTKIVHSLTLVFSIFCLCLLRQRQQKKTLTNVATLGLIRFSMEKKPISNTKRLPAEWEKIMLTKYTKTHTAQC